MSDCPLLAFGLAILASTSCGQTLPQSCSSNVYCQGPLLHDVQMAMLFNDSKTFVDMKLKFSEHEIIAKYRELKEKNGGVIPPNDVLQDFINNNLEDGDELEEWVPPDFTDGSSLAERVTDPQFKEWVRVLNRLHVTAGRKVKEDVQINSELYSLLYVPNGFVIPGGRFKELYYWDTYWIVNGLLLCDMKETARGVIDNLMYLFKEHRIIPNGSRKYYLGRSQPPLLTAMVSDYLNHSSTDEDLEFVRDNMHVLDAEFDFWIRYRSVSVQRGGIPYQLFRYHSSSTGPRPESYREDLETARHLKTEHEKDQLYSRIKSAAESGMDYSSRWFIAKDSTRRGTLNDTDAPNIIPVDLNAFLHNNAKILISLHKRFNNVTMAEYYRKIERILLKNIAAVLWNDEDGIWYDYDLKNKKPRKEYFASNLAPLWTRSYQETQASRLSARVLHYMDRVGLDKYTGGVPMSLNNGTGQQWDYPNTWAPIQGIVIQGLQRLGTPQADRRARTLADNWLTTVLKNYFYWLKIYEKDNVEGQFGVGGEYDVQTGFSLTNSVVLQLLDSYPDLTARTVIGDENGLTNCTKTNTGLIRLVGCLIPSLKDILNFRGI